MLRAGVDRLEPEMLRTAALRGLLAPSLTAARFGDVVRADTGDYQATFFDGVTAIEQATLVSVGQGLITTGIDIAITSVREIV